MPRIGRWKPRPPSSKRCFPNARILLPPPVGRRRCRCRPSRQQRGRSHPYPHPHPSKATRRTRKWKVTRKQKCHPPCISLSPHRPLWYRIPHVEHTTGKRWHPDAWTRPHPSRRDRCTRRKFDFKYPPPIRLVRRKGCRLSPPPLPPAFVPRWYRPRPSPPYKKRIAVDWRARRKEWRTARRTRLPCPCPRPRLPLLLLAQGYLAPRRGEGRKRKKT